MPATNLQQVVSLCKRRGFIFPSSEIYGGLRSCYDYGPLGVELKRNLVNSWWRDMVTDRSDIVGLDASILMHPKVWESSGHVENFTDPLVDCLACQGRFRSDQAPRLDPGAPAPIRLPSASSIRRAQKRLSSISFTVEGDTMHGAVASERGYVCPLCGSPFLSEERSFNLMFETAMGVTGDRTTLYLRPETAQAMFVNFLNVQQSMSMKVPFGIAQIGKSFRNEVSVEHFIFRSCEFEQMECEFFVPPGDGEDYLSAWTGDRMSWWIRQGIDPKNLRHRRHEPDELAHYSTMCSDIEYRFPWGWGELEGIACRTDHDLRAHSKGSGKKLVYFDPEATHPDTGKKGWRYTPHVVEPSAGATRGVLALLCEAYEEEPDTGRTVLRLSPEMAPYKAAVLPLVKRDGMPEVARQLEAEIRDAGLSVSYDEQHSIGKRYARHDEIGTPWCITVDGDTRDDGCVTMRERDSRHQTRVPLDEVVGQLKAELGCV